MKENGERVKCPLCGDTTPVDNFEIQAERMLAWHGATSGEEAKSMALKTFSKIDTH